MTIALRLLGGAGLLVVGWVLVTAWAAVVHGHPAYAVLLVLTLIGSALLIWWSTRRPVRPRGWRLAALLMGGFLVAAWLAVVAWLRPFPAQEPALAAMQSSATVRVTESPTRIVLEPTGPVQPTGVLFQPGAKVDARAYAAVLRPLAEAGYRVVIPKQPLGIAFLATSAFESARDDWPDIASWVVGGHSLGGTMAAMDAVEPGAAGLLLFASYPAEDLSSTLSARVLSVYGTNDGLATPADIAASRSDLPADAQFVPIDGAVHAFFGDYGEQPGDGVPTISHDQARTQISDASLAFVSSLAVP